MSPIINLSTILSKAQGANKPSPNWLGKNTRQRILDLALYLVACVTAGTGLLLAYRLPHGAGNASRVVFWGYGRHEWGDIHTWVAYFGIILAVVHLGLNWQWLVKVAASKHIWRLAGGILLGLLIVVAFLLLPLERA
jgi:hypothetical protein